MNIISSGRSFRRATGGDTIVSLYDIEMTYGIGATAVHAVKRVSLEVRRGEVLFLTGPSGSGKTSLLQVIGLLISPTVGKVHLDGTLLSGLDQRRMSELRRIHCGFVFQSYNLFPTLTAFENVLMACELKNMGRSEGRRRAAELLDRVGLGGKLGSYPAMLSGGQKQRVAVARALAGDPPLILADEPTAALDFESGQQVTALLCDLAHEDGRALVIVTHDPRISGYADRIITLQDGQVVDASERAGA